MTCVGFKRVVARYIAIFVTLPILAGSAVGAESAAAVPDFSGIWAREFIGFGAPDSGQGPIANRARLPTGQADLDHPVGDYTNPILKPPAAEILKQRGQISLRGTNFPTPSNQCALEPMPYILWQQQIQFLQQKDQVVILYQHSNQARHVRLYAQHPARVIPSWTGDSVGRYEGDTLVIDTVGVKVGPLSMADILGTPQSAAVHVVERYRLIAYEAAIEATQRAKKEHILLAGDDPIGDGVAVDPGYKDRGLQLQFTVEDTTVFTMPWSSTNTFLRASGEWVERICAENTHEYYAGIDTAIPTADKPDF